MSLQEENETSRPTSVARRTLAASSGATSIITTRGKTRGHRPSDPRTELYLMHAGEVDDRITLIRRRKAIIDRRRKRIKITIAVLLGIGFPPILLLYLIAWMVWRNKPPQKSSILVDRAIRSLERERTGIALQQLQNAHFLDPSNTDALYWLGLLLVEQGRYEESIEALSIVNERVPGMTEVEAGLLHAFFQTHRYEETIYFAQRVLNRDPFNLPVLSKLAESFAAIGQLGAALETLQHAPLHQQSLDEALKNILYRMGEWYQQLGDHEKSRECFRRIYASDVSFKDVRTRIENQVANQIENQENVPSRR